MKENNIHLMGFHETLLIGNIQIIRVPGGWIYNFQNNGGEVFVPYNAEFKLDKMSLKEKFAQKMLDEKLDFLPLLESVELAESGVVLETKFHWVVNSEELKDNGEDMTIKEVLKEYDDIYGSENTWDLKIGESGEQFDEFTLTLCPAPTYIDLIK